jgi:hypothetical protein
MVMLCQRSYKPASQTYDCIGLLSSRNNQTFSCTDYLSDDMPRCLIINKVTNKPFIIYPNLLKIKREYQNKFTCTDLLYLFQLNHTFVDKLIDVTRTKKKYSAVIVETIQHSSMSFLVNNFLSNISN